MQIGDQNYSYVVVTYPRQNGKENAMNEMIADLYAADIEEGEIEYDCE